MNLVDIAILGIIAVSAVFGLYEGFLVSAMQSVGALASWILSAIFYRPLAGYIAANTDWMNALMYYSAGSAQVADITASNAAITAIPVGEVEALIGTAKLSAPLDKLVTSNIIGRVFAGEGLATVSEYLNQTFVVFMLNALCFIAIFAVCMVLVSVLCNLFGAARKLPVLRQFDSLAGGVFGALRGVLLVMVLFLVYPIVATVLPIKELADMMEKSSLAAWFYEGNAIIHSIKGIL